MTKIIIVSHCILNTCAKVRCFDNGASLAEERTKRLAFLKTCLQNEYQLLQLPCPEFLTFGYKRWGHARSQFDNTFYRKRCHQLLDEFLDQIKEYDKDPDTQILGMIGVNGSPSCGVSKTFDGEWGGEMSTIDDLNNVVENGKLIDGSGIFIQEFKKMLEEEGINIPIVPLGEENKLPGFLN